MEDGNGIQDGYSPEAWLKITTLMKAKGKNSYEYLSRPNVRVCPVCGEVFETAGRGRPKRFCSEKCRTYYHHRYPNPANWKSTRIAVCPVCGQEFQASREYARMRKSHFRSGRKKWGTTKHLRNVEPRGTRSRAS